MLKTTPLPHPQMTMSELLMIFPGARRTLFRRYHLGGCSSCGFSLEETLEQLCARSGNLNPTTVLAEIEAGHLEDEKLFIDPKELHDLLLNLKEKINLLDLRTREEFEAVHIENSQLLTQELMQTAMNSWPKKELIVLIDHTGERGLDAVAYFLGHGFETVKTVRGGIDAYAEQADSNLPRYTIEQE